MRQSACIQFLYLYAHPPLQLSLSRHFFQSVYRSINLTAGFIFVLCLLSKAFILCCKLDVFISFPALHLQYYPLNTVPCFIVYSIFLYWSFGTSICNSCLDFANPQ
jgi:hypothetical protein